MFDPQKLHLRAWLIVALVWGAACLNCLDRLMIVTMRGSIMEEIPMTEAQFGLLTLRMNLRRVLVRRHGFRR